MRLTLNNEEWDMPLKLRQVYKVKYTRTRTLSISKEVCCNELNEYHE